MEEEEEEEQGVRKVGRASAGAIPATSTTPTTSPALPVVVLKIGRYQAGTFEGLKCSRNVAPAADSPWLSEWTTVQMAKTLPTAQMTGLFRLPGLWEAASQ